MSAPQFWRRPTASSSSTSAAIPSVSAIRKSLPSFPSPALRVSRVGQLDAALLDHELEGILGGPLWKALEELRVSSREIITRNIQSLNTGRR